MSDVYKNYRGDDYEEPSSNASPVPEVQTAIIPRRKGSRATLVRRADPNSPDGWRYVVGMKAHVFDDDAKQMFLEEYVKWGRIGESAAASGFTPQTVRKAIDEDPEFAEAVLIAEEAYKDKLIRHHQNLIFNGQVKETFDRNGNLVSREVTYPTRLIELELKKHDPGYREKTEQTINVKRGVMIAPAEMDSIDDWEKKFGDPPMVDITPKEEDKEDREGEEEDPLF